MQIRPTTVMEVSWSADHRVVDGATIAEVPRPHLPAVQMLTLPNHFVPRAVLQLVQAAPREPTHNAAQPTIGAAPYI